MNRYLSFLFIMFIHGLSIYSAKAQDARQLLQKVKSKMDQVKDYVATGTMKTDVVFIKAPISKIKALYQQPDRFQIQRDGGISLLPKGGISVNLKSLLLTDGYTIVDAGNAMLDKTQVRVLKLLPLDEKSDIVLSTIYIDEKQLVIRKSMTTTQQNGTYEMEMFYGKQIQWGLPDRVVFSFNAKEYKLPKGITLEYDDGTRGNKLPQNSKGKIEIIYNDYQINKGLAAGQFK
jgi:outer membrane lipoprotein-sorting protein